jgi:hypothetical protein
MMSCIAGHHMHRPPFYSRLLRWESSHHCQCLYECMNVCTYVCICMYTCMLVRMHVCMHVCMLVCMHPAQFMSSGDISVHRVVVTWRAAHITALRVHCMLAYICVYVHYGRRRSASRRCRTTHSYLPVLCAMPSRIWAAADTLIAQQ